MIKTEKLTLTDAARNEITRCILFWYADACVSDTKKPLFLDNDGDQIVKIEGFDVAVSYEVAT
jgi:hypothetical protein